MPPPGESIILEEEIDENFEPSDAEIAEYAKWLGMDMDKETELMWIAREGLKAPLPEHWKPCKTPEGEIYYFNFSNGESVWEHPCDDFYRSLYMEEKRKLDRRQAEVQSGGAGGAPPAQGRPPLDLGAPSPSGSRRGSLSPAKAVSPPGPFAQHAKPLPNPAAVNPAVRPAARPAARQQEGGGASGSPRGLRGLLGRGKDPGISDPLAGLPSTAAMDGELGDDLIGDGSDSSDASVTNAGDWRAAQDRREDAARTRYLEKLRQEREEWEAGLRAEMREQKARLRAAAEADVAAEVEAVRAERRAAHEAELRELQEAHEAEKRRLQAEQEEEQEEERAAQREAEAEAEAEHRGRLEALRAEHAEAAEALRAELAGELEEARGRGAQEVAAARTAAEAGEEEAAAAREEVRRRAEAEAQAELEALRARRVEELRGEMEAEVAAEVAAQREELLAQAMEAVRAEATAAAEAARGTETAAAMTLMRAAVAAEVEAARERQLEAAEAAGAARPSEAEETDSQREAMRAAVAVKVKAEEEELLRLRRREMEERVLALVAAEEANAKAARRRDSAARVQRELYEEEARLGRERRQEVVERVVAEMGEFEDSLRARLTKEAQERAAQAASSAAQSETRRSRDALKGEVAAEVAAEREALLREARRRVHSEVEAEAERLHLRLRMDQEAGTTAAKAARAGAAAATAAGGEWGSRDRRGEEAAATEAPVLEPAGKPRRARREHRRRGGKIRRAPMSNEDATLLAMAKAYLSQQKRYLQERTELLQHARDQWQASMDRAEAEGVPPSASDSHVMGFVKATLEEQTRRLNSEVRQLKNLKRKVQDMEAGLENVRDITPDVMYMRARSAAAADSPLFAPFAATQGLTGLGAEPLGGDDWGVEYGQRSPLGGADGPTRWMGATSGGILSRMQGERHAVGSLLSTYSTWLKNMIDTVPKVSPSTASMSEQATPGSYGGSAFSTPAPAGYTPHSIISPYPGDGSFRVDLDGRKELVIALRER
eukprot:jgi/Tetstr1/457204/TSEL_043852.t1